MNGVVTLIGLGRGQEVPSGVVVPKPLSALGGPVLQELRPGLTVGLLGGPEPADPLFSALKRRISKQGFTLKIAYGQPLAQALTGRNLPVVTAGPLLPGQILWAGRGRLSPPGLGLFDPRERLRVFSDLRRPGRWATVAEAEGLERGALSAFWRQGGPRLFGLARLVTVMAALRGPEGCPWDQAQTHLSLRPFVLEEANEVADAILEADDGHLEEELGDLLLQVVFHSQLASERSAFDLDHLADRLSEKLIRRHPHVFATETATTPEQVAGLWQAIKAEERRGERRS